MSTDTVMSATPRILPLPLAESLAAAEDANVVSQIAELNIFRTLLKHPHLAKVVNDMLIMLLAVGNRLDPRLRELIIMRTGWATACDYEWTQHWRIALDFGLSEAELLAVRDWTAADCFSASDQAVLAATDDTLEHGHIRASTWEACAAALDTEAELLELNVAIGAWRLISQLARSVNIQLETGIDSWPPDGHAPAMTT
jgi:alkylhydroperoxidase family enzyme